MSADVLYSSSDGNTSREYRLSTSCGTFAVEDTVAGGFDSWDLWQSPRRGGKPTICGLAGIGWGSSRCSRTAVGKVAVIPGAARGQGRSHALRLAWDGADIVVANAGLVAAGKTSRDDEQLCRDIVEIDLFGAWNAITATAPRMIERDNGGSIIECSTQG